MNPSNHSVYRQACILSSSCWFAYQKIVTKHGGVNKSSVTQDLSYLVCNEDRGSSKTRKAQKYIKEGLDLQIITTEQFLAMVPEEKTEPKTKIESYSLFDD